MKYSILIYLLVGILFIPVILSKKYDGSEGKFVDIEAINKYIRFGFTTKRLKANLTTRADIEELYKYVLDNEYMYPYDDTIKQPKTKEEAIKYLEDQLKLKDSFYFCIKLKETNTPIGQINFKFFRKGVLTVSYWIAKEYSNKKYLTEIGRSFIEDLFINSKKVEILELYTLDSNKYSQRFIDGLFFYLEDKYKFSSKRYYSKYDKSLVKFHYLFKK